MGMHSSSAASRERASPAGASVQQLVRAAYAQLKFTVGATFKARLGQRQMIGAVASAVAAGVQYGAAAGGARIIAVQAPTGSGKTLAYGVASVPIARAAGKKVVISTATTALQSQLMDKDMLTLQRAMPGMTFAIAKGRNRYLCPVRLERALAQRASASADSEALKSLAARFGSGDWDGDMDSLKEPVAQNAWRRVTNDSKGCSGRSCGSVSTCPYYKARSAIAQADVVVANHDLVLADLLGFGGILPAPAETVFVIDEAHHLADKATKTLESSHRLSDGIRWAANGKRVMHALVGVSGDRSVDGLAEKACAALAKLSQALVAAETNLRDSVAGQRQPDGTSAVKLEELKLGGDLARVVGSCSKEAVLACDALLDVREQLGGERGKDLPAVTRDGLLSDIGELMTNIEAVRDTWGLLSVDSYGNAPVAHWVSFERAGGVEEIRVCASPTSAAETLHEVLWSRACSVVACSATLTSVGGFKPFLSETGLALTTGVQTIEIASPFDYAAQGKLVIPKMAASAKDAAGHTKELIRLLPLALRSMRPASGCVVIFSSWTQLEAVAGNMPDWVKGVLQIQPRSGGKAAMVAAHVAAISAGRCSVMFGTASLEEGLDLPGALCQMVMIAKLPFAVPTHPVDEARKAWVENKGGNYFTDVVVPLAFRRLAQGLGRLIRSETDTGTVVVFDERLRTTGYGKKMLRALPPFAVTDMLPGHIPPPW